MPNIAEEIIEDFIGFQRKFMFTIHRHTIDEDSADCLEYNVSERVQRGVQYEYKLLPYSLMRCIEKTSDSSWRVRIEIINTDNDEIVDVREFIIKS